jgi:hypothetical protein
VWRCIHQKRPIKIFRNCDISTTHNPPDKPNPLLTNSSTLSRLCKKKDQRLRLPSTQHYSNLDSNNFLDTTINQPPAAVQNKGATETYTFDSRISSRRTTHTSSPFILQVNWVGPQVPIADGWSCYWETSCILFEQFVL